MGMGPLFNQQDARISNLETGLSSLQASLVNIYPLSTSRLGSSLGPRHLRSLYPWVRLPVGGVPVSGIVHMRSYLPVTPVGWDHNHTFSQPVFFLSLASKRTMKIGRLVSNGCTLLVGCLLRIVRWRIVLWTFLWNLV